MGKKAAGDEGEDDKALTSCLWEGQAADVLANKDKNLLPHGPSPVKQLIVLLCRHLYQRVCEAPAGEAESRNHSLSAGCYKPGLCI